MENYSSQTWQSPHQSTLQMYADHNRASSLEFAPRSSKFSSFYPPPQMVTSMSWHATAPILSVLTDCRLVVWTYPQACLVDPDLKNLISVGVVGAISSPLVIFIFQTSYDGPFDVHTTVISHGYSQVMLISLYSFCLFPTLMTNRWCHVWPLEACISQVGAILLAWDYNASPIPNIHWP